MFSLSFNRSLSKTTVATPTDPVSRHYCRLRPHTSLRTLLLTMSARCFTQDARRITPTRMIFDCLALLMITASRNQIFMSLNRTCILQCQPLTRFSSIFKEPSEDDSTNKRFHLLFLSYSFAPFQICYTALLYYY